MSHFIHDSRAMGRFAPEGIHVVSSGVELPILPLSGAVLFPHNSLPIASLKGLRAADLKAAQRGGFRVGVVTTQNHAGRNKIKWSRVGVEAEVVSLLKLPNGETGAVLEGRRRFILKNLKKHRYGWVGRVDIVMDRPAKRTKAFLATVKTLKSDIQRLLRAQPDILPETNARLQSSDDPAFLCDAIAPHLSLTLEERLQYLEQFDLRTRVRGMLGMLKREMNLHKMSEDIHDQVKGDLQEEQRRHYLREQIQVIRRELGELEGTQGVEQLEDSLAQMELPDLAAAAVKEELERLALSSPGNPEYMVSYNYLQFMAALPWGAVTPRKSPSLRKAAAILNRDHYGLQAVKDRILEYLAVALHKGTPPGQILLFAGPPGVGKTSLARSIAEALDRPFARISLGGVKDEAEIRGHRRTYIGSMPGKLMQAIKQAGARDPVILLDEIDKLSGEAGGDLAAALLEVLDREQNRTFVDHYLAVPFDLSQVIFIATANETGRMSDPLLDRMDVVDVTSYTDREKIEIAQKYLLPELREELGLTTRQFRLADKSIELILRHYTREAGVRQLKRELAVLGRKVVRQLMDNRRRKTLAPSLTAPLLAQWLGPPRYIDEPMDATLAPGVAIGLAYTSVGGDILYVESTQIPLSQGGPTLKLTGSLGAVMKESAETVLSWLQVHAETYGVDRSMLERGLIHLHFPDGGTPKDGPSAGIAILCALLSLLRQQSLPVDLAMTGEVTLRGQVLAVGGIREKVLAAARYGKQRVLIPAANLSDLEHIPAEVRANLAIRPVATMAEVIYEAFGPLEAASGEELRPTEPASELSL